MNKLFKKIIVFGSFLGITVGFCIDRIQLELFDASLGGKSFIDHCLEKGVNIITPNRLSLLHVAAAKGNTNAVVELIKNGAEVNLVVEQYGTTPLYFAAANGHLEIANILIKAGANIDAVINNHPELRARTPLHIAVSNEDLNMVKAFISEGCNLNMEVEGKTALLFAINNLDIEMVRTLISAGASPLILVKINNLQLSLLSIALTLSKHTDQNSIFEIIELLKAEGVKENIISPGGFSELHFAAKEGNIEEAERLIANGADVNLETDEGETPIYSAVYYGHIRMAEILIRNGANVNTRIKKRKGGRRSTPLSCAVVQQMHGMAMLLTSSGANVHQTIKIDGKEISLLDMAIRNKDQEMVAILKAAGAED